MYWMDVGYRKLVVVARDEWMEEEVEDAEADHLSKRWAIAPAAWVDPAPRAPAPNQLIQGDTCAALSLLPLSA